MANKGQRMGNVSGQLTRWSTKRTWVERAAFDALLDRAYRDRGIQEV